MPRSGYDGTDYGDWRLMAYAVSAFGVEWGLGSTLGRTHWARDGKIVINALPFSRHSMVLAGKIFLVREETDIETIALKLRDYKTSETVEQNGRKFELITEVQDLKIGADYLQGNFSQDNLITIYHHGEVIPTPKTMVAPFIFNRVDSRIMLIVLEKKQKANNVANSVSKILFITTGQVVEARISPETLRRFHEDNFEDTKIIFFDDVDVPNVNKLSLYGSALGGTTLYTDYLKHGNLWYTVLKSRKYGYIVGLTRNCVVTIFSRIEEPEFINYISKEIIPLIS